MKVILVTGASGLLGSKVIELLSKDNNILISKRHGVSDKNTLIGDISNSAWPDMAAEFLSEYSLDSIIHLGGQSAVWRSVKYPRKDVCDNLVSTVNVLELARIRSVKNVIFSSSEAVFGDLVYPLEGDPHMPVSPYGISKSACESYVNLYARVYGIQTYILRPSFILGSGLKRNLVYDVVAAHLEGRRDLTMPFRGSSKFNFVDVLCVASYIQDIVYNGGPQRDINVVGEQNYTADDIVALISELLDAPISCEFSGDSERIACMKSNFQDQYANFQVDISKSIREVIRGMVKK